MVESVRPSFHPVPARRGKADSHSGEEFVRQAPSDLEQILPIFFFGTSAVEHIRGRIVHTA